MIFLKKISLLILLFSINTITYAQCAMCKAVVESNQQSGSAVGEGINNGILYLMFIPYLLMGTVGFFIYRHYKKNKELEQAQAT